MCSGSIRSRTRFLLLSRTGALPLSVAQRSLWFQSQLAPDSAVYNLPASVRLRGALDVEALASATREVLARRFPALTAAPLVESRVCQYENSPDGHLILDRHPQAENLWLAGGGSGHGFKLAPVVGEHVAALVRGEARPLPQFALARLARWRAAGGAATTQFEAR